MGIRLALGYKCLDSLYNTKLILITLASPAELVCNLKVRIITEGL